MVRLPKFLKRDVYESISPADYRYWDPDVARYLSENAFTAYLLRVEVALIAVLHRNGMAPASAVLQAQAAAGKITTHQVYLEENRIKHDIRALVNLIRAKMSVKNKPFVHTPATSFDIRDTATAMRYRDVTLQVVVPELIKLEKVLISIAIREAATVQVGRTHGQHASPITFGYFIAGYVSRLGKSIEALKALATELEGKFSGSVGSYNASSLFFSDPRSFEGEILSLLNLKQAQHSTQIAPSEPLIRLLCEIMIAQGILADLSDSLRHLQRTEIGEVGEPFEDEQVGSSMMPQKRNPIGFENLKSLWKISLGRLVTVFLDQLSEHQRDLTNSASGRSYGESVNYLVAGTKRLTRILAKLEVDRTHMQNNLDLQKGLVLAEPLQIILSFLGHPDAHEQVRRLTQQAIRNGVGMEDLLASDPELVPYILRMSDDQRRIMSDPTLYTGIAEKRAIEIAQIWQAVFQN